MTGSVRIVSFCMNKLLRDNVPSINYGGRYHVYPTGIREDAETPRIILNCITPSEKFVVLGSGLPVLKQVSFKVDVYSRNPQQCDSVAGEVEDAIANNRNYRISTVTMSDYSGKTSTVNTNGYFLMLKTAGGNETILVPSLNMYHRTVLVTGSWMQQT